MDVLSIYEDEKKSENMLSLSGDFDVHSNTFPVATGSGENVVFSAAVMFETKQADIYLKRKGNNWSVYVSGRKSEYV